MLEWLLTAVGWGPAGGSCVPRMFYDCLVHWTGAAPAEHYSHLKRPAYSRCRRHHPFLVRSRLLSAVCCLLLPAARCPLPATSSCPPSSSRQTRRETQRTADEKHSTRTASACTGTSRLHAASSRCHCPGLTTTCARVGPPPARTATAQMPWTDAVAGWSPVQRTWMQKINLMQMWMFLVRAYVVRANQVCACFNLLVVRSKTVSTRPRRPRPRFANRWTIKEVNQRETRRMLTLVYLCTWMTLCAVRCDDLSGLKSILHTCAWAPANSAAATALAVSARGRGDRSVAPSHADGQSSHVRSWEP